MSESTSLAPEARTIDFIPENERHGRARDLFTIWFGSNIMLLTVATGVIATAVYELPLWAAFVALLLGNLLGGIVMALHAAQGPQMGIPQMLQTRAQFGSQGSLLVVVLVIAMYTGFFASNMALGAQALVNLTGIGLMPALVLIGLLSVVGAMFGYRIIHGFTGMMSIIAGATMLLAFLWILVVRGLPQEVWQPHGATLAGFMGTISLAALWQIAYAPYVSDYTRYMPKDTGVRPAFWATYSGCVLGSYLPMLLGAIIGAAMPNADPVSGLDTLTGSLGAVVVGVFAVGIATTNAMNLYCGALSTITVGQTLFPAWMPRAATRGMISFIIFLVALAMASVGAENFLTNFVNFMLTLLCVLIPWTAINLVDYYVLRHGDYDMESIFRRDGGIYGRINIVAVFCYFVGILIQIPFLATAMYTGPIAARLGGVDVSWIVGLLAISPLYYVLMRRFAERLPHPNHF